MLAEFVLTLLSALVLPRPRSRRAVASKLLKTDTVRLKLGAASAAVFLLFLLPPCRAQITDITNTTHTPTAGEGHDYIKFFNETVNPANGSVSLRISVPVPPDRGITVPFSFAYDSGAAFHVQPSQVGGYATWFEDIRFLAKGGWSYTLPSLSTQIAFRAENPTPPPHGNYCYYATGYVMEDAAGGTHALGLSPRDPTYVTDCQTAYIPSMSNILFGGDDYFTATTTNIANEIIPPVTATDADGTVYQFPTLYQHNPAGGQSYAGLPTSITDRNGNQTTFTDTFNAAGTSGQITVKNPLHSNPPALTITNFGTSGSTVTPLGLNGSYTVNWSTQTVTHLQATPITTW